MDAILYHNPRCSKSRQALQLLREQGIEPVIIEYLKHPPAREELGRLLALLGMEPRALMRRKERIYRDKGLDDPRLKREDLIEAMVRDPILIERPILVCRDKAVLGRPPERILEII